MGRPTYGAFFEKFVTMKRPISWTPTKWGPHCIVFYLVGLYPKLGQGVNSPVKMDIFTPGLQGPWRISRGDVGLRLINPFNSGTFKNIGFYRKTLL